MDNEYALVMPFVLVKSEGGEYNDNAYVAGWRLGELSAQLSSEADTHANTLEATLPTSDTRQVDLIAMRYGFTMVAEAIDDHFTIFTFTREDTSNGV